MFRQSATHRALRLSIAAILIIIGIVSVSSKRNLILISQAQVRTVPQRPVTSAGNSTGKLPPAPFDLVWDSEDDNGLPLNPKWGWQITHGGAPDPNLCANGPFKSPCTTWPYDDKNLDTANICKADTLVGEHLLFGVAGHYNWAAATYVGRIDWETHSAPCDSVSFFDQIAAYATGQGGAPSCDDDYNFNLYTPGGAGLTTARDSIECEFDSDETIDHFDTPWWNLLHKTVDDSVNDLQVGETLFKEHGERGRYAIVTGLIGLEFAHSASTELHPVWAMAIRVKDDDPMDEVWAIFIRRWGNEGFCSSGNQHLLKDLPNNTYTFRLPWRPGASDLKLGPATAFKGNYNFTGTAEAVANQGVLVSFPAPPFGSGLPLLPRIDGELHLQWPGGRWAQPAPIPAAGPAPIPQTCEQGCNSDCYEFRRGTQQYQQCKDKCMQQCQRKSQAKSKTPEPEEVFGSMVAKMTQAQRRQLITPYPTSPLVRDGQIGWLTVMRVQSLPKHVARPRRVQFGSVPDAQQIARKQRLLDTVRKINVRPTR
jgi:hypothetical protein